ncbi:MAG: DUF4127 family protein [Vulcanimicrobiaceae bacterium]
MRRVARAIALAAIVAVTRGAAVASEPPAIAFVPLDDRPVTYQLPVRLGDIAGQPIVTPPHASIGTYLRAGDPEAIARWLRGPQVQGVRAVVASSDMLAYGGLVASRIPGVGTGEAYVRLRDFARLKTERAIPYVGLFGTIMRLAPTGVPRLGGAAAYYAAGPTVEEIAAYANLPDPPRTDDDRRRGAALREQIGPRTLDAYLGARARNRDVDEWALQLAAEGGIDRVVIGQDDAGPTGLHLKDVAALKAAARRFGLGERASIEPGADELGMVMLARVLARDVGWTPTVSLAYSRPDGGAVNDELEYVPIETTIDQIVRACGATRVARGADIALYVRVAQTTAADEATFEDRIAADVARGTSVAVADLTFLTGKPTQEQRALTQALIDRKLAGKIDAFASWNTDANTIGTALPEAIAVGAGRRAKRYDARAHAQFMLDRYIDDYAYHQFVRPDLNESLRARSIDTSLLLPDVAREAASRGRASLWPYALQLLESIYPQYRNAGLTITLPWDRTFETQIDVRLAPVPTPARLPAPSASAGGK